MSTWPALLAILRMLGLLNAEPCDLGVDTTHTITLPPSCPADEAPGLIKVGGAGFRPDPDRD